MADVFERSLALHEKLKGKMSTELKAPLENQEDLSLLYSPGVAQPCREIAKDAEKAYDYTWKGNTVAVVSNGTAVLGLGNIGAEAALPVMEGKCALFKRFGGVNAVPIVLRTTDPKEVIEIVKQISPTFGGINLEDIKAPECIEIETTLKKECNIPVFHDDQHGTAIVVTAAVINAFKLVKKNAEDCTVVVSGVGAAGSSIIRMLRNLGIGNVYGFNSKGVLNLAHAEEYTNPLYKELAKITNKNHEDLSLEEAMAKADLFVGVSVPNKISEDMVRSMRRDPIVLAMANPDPEIDYDLARKAGARVVGTGRSDYPNQVNNVLAFPGLFKGALSVHATEINEEMKFAAAKALAELVSEEELKEEYVIPSPFDPRVPDAVAKSVAQCAIETGVARQK
ncbi:MAG: NAD-dependent malic enzyme [Peptoniphilaceae bacterium]|nr:NAD-dependent malic enzyme [Peptoniphilaceae bacterium]MDD7543633.1 NAD-dependent malic enzyme [Peptoniphilaceae bacterium]MDY4197096.1 malic enzyme-like NAD(P)-binding protein [Peptoniphilaceae bacterium]MDY5765546.1 malic enzyme-like NAD(P)-binding protein [Peptoniphilaceae bacterium]MDY5841506.1 malic enzyme-like NAD(P)-binding protein [Peptoniphilaceae bacterium]